VSLSHGVQKVAAGFFDDFDKEDSAPSPVAVKSASPRVDERSGSSGSGRLAYEDGGAASRQPQILKASNAATAARAQASASATTSAPVRQTQAGAAAHKHSLWDDDDDAKAKPRAQPTSSRYGGSGGGSTGGSDWGNTGSDGYDSRDSWSASNASASRSYLDDYRSSQNPSSSSSASYRDEGEGAQKKFGSSAKAISSDQYFGRDDAGNGNGNGGASQRFAGATSISSAQFYNRDESGMAAQRQARYDDGGSMDLLGGVDLEAAKEKAMQVGQKLTSLAKEWMEDWGGY